MNPHTALMIIDAQVNMFDPQHSVHNAEGILKKLQTLLSLARASNTLVVYVQNNGRPGEVDEPRTEGWLLHPELPIKDGDLIVQKTELDAFSKTDFYSRLQKIGIKKLIIAGMQSEYCIAANCKKARELGFDVILVMDAHTTYPSAEQTALDIIDEVNEGLKGVVTFWRIEDLETF